MHKCSAKKLSMDSLTMKFDWFKNYTKYGHIMLHYIPKNEILVTQNSYTIIPKKEILVTQKSQKVDNVVHFFTSKKEILLHKICKKWTTLSTFSRQKRKFL